MTPSTATVTLLFTDLVNSTELLERLGDDAAEQVRRAHFRLLRDAVATCGGEEVKNLGDGLMVAFASAVDAVGCAVAMQQAVHRYNHRQGTQDLQVRVGLHVGEPIRDEDDYFGTPVVVAKRLCDRAQGGQILLSDLVRGLVGARGNFTFRDAGALPLKGLATPVAAYEVVWESAPAQPLPLPAALAANERTPFVGRTRELALLDAAWQRVRKPRQPPAEDAHLLRLTPELRPPRPRSQPAPRVAALPLRDALVPRHARGARDAGSTTRFVLVTVRARRRRHRAERDRVAGDHRDR
jgi:class 3 adenylate cyclase